MIFTLLVTTHPYTQAGALTAYRFCMAALQDAHRVRSVFFKDDGVYHASSLAIPPASECVPSDAWVSVSQTQGVPLYLCSASAAHRGVLTEAQAQFYEKPTHYCLEAFTLAGLGQLWMDIEYSDRLVTF